MLVDLGSVTIVVPNGLVQTPEECPEKTLGNLAASNYFLTRSTTGRLVPFGTSTCFENPVSFREPAPGSLSCFMDIAYGAGEFLGPMVTDAMSIAGEDFVVDFGMPVRSYDCSLAATRILGMNRGQASFLSQAYNHGKIDEKLVGICGSREAPVMALGSAALTPSAKLPASAFPLHEGAQLEELTEYMDDEDFMKSAKGVANSSVELEHYYTVIDSVVIGADSFSTPHVAMIDSGWTSLALPESMVESIASYVNQSLIENGMEDDFTLVMLDQDFPQACVGYNTEDYPDAIAIANTLYPTIDITLQGGSFVSINLTETAGLYESFGGKELMCANIEVKSTGPIMLGTPFFLDRYVKLDQDTNTGSFTDIVDCAKVKEMLSPDHGQESPSPSSGATDHSAWLLLFFFVLSLIA